MPELEYRIQAYILDNLEGLGSAQTTLIPLELQ